MIRIRYCSFVGGLLFTVMLMLIMGGSTVFSFDWFKVWTAQENLKIGHGDYVPSLRVDDTVIAIALANMRLGNGQSHIIVDQKNSNTFRIMNEQRALLSVDIMDLLKQEHTDNAQLLQEHIRHLELVRTKTTNSIAMLQERAQQLLAESQECLNQKRAGDQQFFAGAGQWNDAETQAGLAQSLEYAPCYITKRIEANASSYLASYVGASLPLLEQRIQILSLNKDNLLNYKGLFEGNVLDELQMIKQQVNAISLTPTDMDNVFSFWKFDQNTKLPTYNLNTIWFPGGKIPTYSDPGVKIQTSGF